MANRSKDSGDSISYRRQPPNNVDEVREVASSQAFLHAYGIETSAGSLHEMLVEAVRSLPRSLSGAPTTELTASEAQVFEAGGFVLEPAPSARDPLAESAAEYAAILESALSTQEVSEMLGVDPSRIRQRLTSIPPTLYGVRVGSTWQLPRFQFDRDQLVPGVETVIRQLDSELSPLAVHRWMTTPSHDLVDERASADPLSPRDWLLQGHPAARAAELAAVL